MSDRPNPPTPGARPPGGSGQGQGQNQPPLPLADLNRIVLEFLNRKGYTRTEAMFRMESSRTPAPPSNSVGPNGGPSTGALPRQASPNVSQNAIGSAGNDDPSLYPHAYLALKDWADNSLDLYQPELRRILYPVFVHMFLQLIAKGHTKTAKKFFHDFAADHTVLHGDDIKRLESISLPQHVKENELANLFKNKEYSVNISRTCLDLLLFFLHEIELQGGSIIIRLLNQYLALKVTDGRPGAFDTEEVLDPNEGLGASGINQVDQFNSQAVKLGKMPMDADLQKEVTAALEAKDKAEAPSEENIGSASGKTLVEQFNKEFKADDDLEAPSRENFPLPQYKAADVEREILKVQEARSRISLGPTQTSRPSICMYTFHNTHDGMNNLEFSEDSTMVAAGFEDSFVKIWSLKGEKIKSALKDDEPSTSKRLVGHSGPVYGLSFSPDNRYLLSSSEDKTVRLWSLDTYTGLVAYKGHNHPVWDVAFSPFGHYFATASHDQTARLWSCDHIYPLRIFAGHLSDVDTVSFHPNGTYLFTGSSDKTCRMWDINKGSSVRVFIGHTGPINCTAVSPDGRWLASAGEDSVIHVWDLGSGRRLKSMRGHGQASIYSLAFSQEGSLLVSGGADNSVRVWDIRKGTGDAGPEPEPMDEEVKTAIGEAANVDASGRKKKKEIQATADHLAVFHTKRTPVYTLKFTRKNLCLAGGSFSG